MATKQKRTDNLTRAEFKERVLKYFEYVGEANKKKKVEGGVAIPLTPPGLAQWLNWSTEKLVTYPEDGIFFDIVELAMQQCENFIVEAIFSKSLDKGIGTLMLRTYFGYSDTKSKAEAKLQKAKRSISKVLDEMDNAKTSE